MRLINILIIEDNIFDYESASRSLGYLDSIGKIIYLDNGEKAIEYLFQTGAYANVDQYIQPDLILLDIELPKLNGKEVLKEIKEKGSEEIKNIPVIFFTSIEDSFNNQECFELGAKGYLNKPIRIDHFKDFLVAFGLI